MATICPTCKSATTQALVDKQQCLECGQLFGFDGKPAQPGPSQEMRDAAIRKANATYAPVVVGNIADLQRAGADAAKAGNVVLAPGIRPESVITPAELDVARGEVTRETERVGAGGDEVTATSAASEQPKGRSRR